MLVLHPAPVCGRLVPWRATTRRARGLWGGEGGLVSVDTVDQRAERLARVAIEQRVAGAGLLSGEAERGLAFSQPRLHLDPIPALFLQLTNRLFKLLPLLEVARLCYAHLDAQLCEFLLFSKVDGTVL